MGSSPLSAIRRRMECAGGDERAVDVLRRALWRRPKMEGSMCEPSPSPWRNSAIMWPRIFSALSPICETVCTRRCSPSMPGRHLHLGGYAHRQAGTVATWRLRRSRCGLATGRSMNSVFAAASFGMLQMGRCRHRNPKQFLGAPCGRCGSIRDSAVTTRAVPASWNNQKPDASRRRRLAWKAARRRFSVARSAEYVESGYVLGRLGSAKRVTVPCIAPPTSIAPP